jgi:small subunit ribosomal protein S20
MRQNAKRRSRNRRRKEQARGVVKSFESVLKTGDKAKAGEELKKVYKALDTGAAKGTMHKNAAARKKSRLARRLAKAS